MLFAHKTFAAAASLDQSPNVCSTSFTFIAHTSFAAATTLDMRYVHCAYADRRGSGLMVSWQILLVRFSARVIDFPHVYNALRGGEGDRLSYQL